MKVKILKSFASDNYAGVHSEVMAAMAAVNDGHAVAYGDDPTTDDVRELIKAEFGANAEMFIVFNGTGANVIALQSALRPWENVICSQMAHINVDESGAPERLTGSKLVAVPTPDGKLTPAMIRAAYTGAGDQHHTQPKVVSITQSTELGTVYTVEEVRAIVDASHTMGMKVHMDGARISNAAVSLGARFRDFTTEAGVDVLSFGGTKNGLMGAEAVVFLNPELASQALWIRKSSMQLASKHRYVAAQLKALLTNDLWRRNASHANEMAQRLAAGLREVSNLRITQTVQANGVFVEMPRPILKGLQAAFPFYLWNPATGEARLMCSWDTNAQEVDAFVSLARDLTNA